MQCEILIAYKKLHGYLTKQGLYQKLQWLENEASRIICDKMDLQRNNFQLVPPHIHRGNVVEKEIWTLKNYFMMGLAITDKKFLIHLQDRLFPQVVTTLNLLRKSIINTILLEESQLNKQFNYDAIPMAPLGDPVIIHDKSQQHGSWGPYVIMVWYGGNAQHHYH